MTVKTHVINNEVSVYIYPDGSVLMSQRHTGDVALEPSEVPILAAVLAALPPQARPPRNPTGDDGGDFGAK